MKRVLPIGFTYQDEDITSFDVNLVGGFMERIIHNEVMRREKPQTWTASVLSGLLNTLGSKNVSYEFEESSGKKIPEIVKHIPLPDAAAILVAGHAETFGSVLKRQQCRCGRCNSTNFVDIDLESLKIPDNKGVIGSLTVTLNRGWQRRSDKKLAGQKELGWEDKVFKVMTFKIPTIGDALRNEKTYSPTRILDFQVKLVNDNLTSFKTLEDGFQIPQDMFESMIAGNMIFADRGGLIADDRILVRDAMNGLPQIDMLVETQCGECQTTIKTALDYASFFPLVS
jgi:hypothetical protein